MVARARAHTNTISLTFTREEDAEHSGQEYGNGCGRRGGGGGITAAVENLFCCFWGGLGKPVRPLTSLGLSVPAALLLISGSVCVSFGHNDSKFQAYRFQPGAGRRKCKRCGTSVLLLRVPRELGVFGPPVLYCSVWVETEIHLILLCLF